jgi:hypothetical protein
MAVPHGLCRSCTGALYLFSDPPRPCQCWCAGLFASFVSYCQMLILRNIVRCRGNKWSPCITRNLALREASWSVTPHRGPSHPFKMSKRSPSSATSSKAEIRSFAFTCFRHCWPSSQGIIFLYCKISSPGPVFHGTKWLLWRPHIQSPTLHSRCGINKGLIKRGITIDHWRSQCKGWILWPTPYTYIHTYIHTYIYFCIPVIGVFVILIFYFVIFAHRSICFGSWIFFFALNRVFTYVLGLQEKTDYTIQLIHTHGHHDFESSPGLGYVHAFSSI